MTQNLSTPNSVLIIGAGLAGMAAAVALESAAVRVTLLESRRSLGGRASSFDDPQSSEELDNCQHVLLGCCTNLIDFYQRTGALAPSSEIKNQKSKIKNLIQFERTIHFRDEKGTRFDLYGVPNVPAPLNLAPSLAAFSALTLAERLALSRAMLAIMRNDPVPDVPFGDWLAQHRQPPSLIQKLYDPIIISALNEETRIASARYAVKVFKDSLLANEAGYLFGLPNCPLSQLYSRLPCRDVRLGTRVSEILFNDRRIAGVKLQDGQVLTADAYVIATNFHAAQKWAPPGLAALDSRFTRLDEIQTVPILGAHLWFDRPVLTDSHAALITGPLQWLFRKDASGCCVHGVISAARQWLNRPREECLKIFEHQIRQVLPEARNAKLVRGVMVIEKRATFSPLPGIDSIRPTQAPPRDGIQNLYLAGDYTQTGWPSTMEGAVRSGYLAAEALLNLPNRFLVPDLPLEWPARLLQRGKPPYARSATSESDGPP